MIIQHCSYAVKPLNSGQGTSIFSTIEGLSTGKGFSLLCVLYEMDSV